VEEKEKAISGYLYVKKQISSSDDRSACKINQEVTPMDKAALQKHEIYNKLMGLEEPELGAIVDYIDFMRHKKKLGEKKIIKLEGILKGYTIDFSELKKLREQTWKHVEEESSGE
jgi:hypothetical protein